MIAFFISLCIILIAFNVLIVLHEFGHYLAARIAGVTVQEVSIGLGPVLFERQCSTFPIRLRAYPLGGYVKIFDRIEQSTQPVSKGRALAEVAFLKQAFIILAGVWMNLFVAVALFAFAYKVGFKLPKCVVDYNLPKSYAALAGVGRGKAIVGVDGVKTPSILRVQYQLLSALGVKDEIKITLQDTRGKVKDKVLHVANWDISIENPNLLEHIGIKLKRPLKLSDYNTFEEKDWTLAFQSGAEEASYWLAYQWLTLKKLATLKLSTAHLMGPFSLIKTLHLSLQFQWILFFYLIAALSTVLALINALPIPGLDGGLLIYRLIAALTKFDVPVTWQNLLFRLAVIFFTVIFIQVTLIDLLRLFAAN